MNGRSTKICDGCGSTWLVVDDEVCPACRTGRLVDVERPVDGTPEVVVRFAIDEAEAGRRLGEHVAAASMAVADAQGVSDRLVAHYIPAWLVDAGLVATFEGEVGFDVQVQSTVEQCRNGRWTSVPVTETRVRWEARAGTLERGFDNEAAPALSTWNAWLRVVDVPEPIVGGSLKDGHPVLLPDRPASMAWNDAARGLRKRAGQQIAAASGAQHAREVYFRERWEDVHWTWVLFPVYSASYVDAAGVTRVLRVDGRTGRVSGLVAADPMKGWLYAGCGRRSAWSCSGSPP